MSTLTVTEIEELRAENARLDQRVREALARQREINQRIDELALTLKPEIPTQAQRDGLAEAVRRIRAGEKPSTHHGDPTPTYDVLVDGSRGWLHVRHGAPYAATRTGHRLWQFTDTDVEALIAVLVDLGMIVTDWWISDGGVSIRLLSGGNRRV